MALVKYNDNSISAVTSTALAEGSLVPIKTLTASSSSTLSFVHGSSDVVLDGTYPIYVFKFINLHPQTNAVNVTFNLSTDGGSNYNVSKTTTSHGAYHDEEDANSGLQYSSEDLANGTGYQNITCQSVLGNENKECLSGQMFLFNPSSTTFVKHFMIESVDPHHVTLANHNFVAGYANTTSSINAIDFKMASGNIDSGTIKLYGIKDS